MKPRRKEILISIAALLLLTFAVAAFLRLVRSRQANLDIGLYALALPASDAVLAINRPDLFRQMIASDPRISKLFSDAIPDICLSAIRQLRLRSALISFHPQGAICCIHSDAPGTVADHARKHLGEYPPRKVKAANVDYYYLPDINNRFFGYYTLNNIWVGSHIRKLLERTALRARRNEILPADELSAQLEETDRNSPATLIFHPSAIGLDIIPEYAEAGYISADLFLSESSFCAHVHLPSLDENTEALLDSFLREKYPQLRFTFQISTENDGIALTACTPIGGEIPAIVGNLSHSAGYSPAPLYLSHSNHR